MSKPIKIVIAIVSVIVVLMIAGFIAIKAFLTPERLRQISEQIASQSLQRPVEIGTVNLSVGFGVSISIQDVSIPNTKGFSTQPMIEIERTVLNLKFLPLLQRRIVIGSIDFDRFVLNLERNARKELNVLTLMPKEAKGQGWAMSLDKLRLKKCEVKYYDAITKSRYRFFDINQEVNFRKNRISLRGRQRVSVPGNELLPADDIIIENSVEYDTLSKDMKVKNIRVRIDPAQMTISGNIEKGESVDLRGEITLDRMSRITGMLPEEYRFERLEGALRGEFTVSGTTKDPKIEGGCEIEEVTIMPKGMSRALERINGAFKFNRTSVHEIRIEGNIGKTKFAIGGDISNLDKPAPLLNISTELTGNLDDFQSLTPEMKDVKLSGKINGKITLKGTFKDPSYFGDIRISDGLIDGIGMGKPLTGFTLKATMQNNAGRVTECRGRIGKSDFSLTGFVSNFKKPVAQINSRSNLIDLDEILPEKGTSASRSGRSKPAKAVPLTIQGTVVVKKLTGLDMEFTNVNANFSYVDGVIDLKNCRAQAYDGQVNFDFYYNAYSPEPYRINSRMTSVQAQKVTKRLLGFDKIKGDLSGVANFNGNGLDRQSVQSNISGRGNLKVINGEFNNFDFLVKLLEWIGIKGQKVVRFNTFNTGFTVANGRARADDWTLSARVGDFLIGGTIGLNGTIDMNIAVTLSKHYSDIVKRHHGDWIFFGDKEGRTVIDVIAKGSMKKPRFTLDRNRIKERIKGNIKNEFDKKIKDFESDLKNILKGIR
ncbi:MAG: AsmA family protein [candidate division WOR-3 bacterium]|nr:MAG: AsmA family protein [candidate division WOR-3 bacterium]